MRFLPKVQPAAYSSSCAGIPSRSRRRNGSQYSRSVASSSPPKRPQSARVPNGTSSCRPGSPAPGSPIKQCESVNPTPSHRRGRSWVPHWSSKKETVAGVLEDQGVAELATDVSEMQDVQDADKSFKSKKGWSWWSRNKEPSTTAPAVEDDEEVRDQGNVAEASPVNAATSDAKARSPVRAFDLTLGLTSLLALAHTSRWQYLHLRHNAFRRAQYRASTRIAARFCGVYVCYEEPLQSPSLHMHHSP